MLIPTISWGYHSLPVTEVLVEIGWDIPERIPNPTEFEMDRCPATFRCFACLEKKGKVRHFGGEVLEKRICRTCYPYCDEAVVGGMVRFDERHGFPID